MFEATKAKIFVSPSAGIQIHEKANFDFKKLYKFMQLWIKSKNYDFFEKENTHKTASSGEELTIRFVGEREVDDYVKYDIEILMRILDMEKITIETSKGKIRLDTGQLYINIKAIATIDYRGIWSKTKFDKLLGYIYNNYIIRKKIEQKYCGNLYGEMMDFYNGIKEHLDLYR